MSKVVGYSVVNVTTGNVISSPLFLPARVVLPNQGVVDFDKPGQVAPSSDNPLYKIVERVTDETVPEGMRITGEDAGVFDGEQIVITRTYAFIPEPEELTPAQRLEAVTGLSIEELRTLLQ